MRERVDAFGVSEPELLHVGLATRSRSTCRASTNAERAAQQVGSTAQLFFYDWEANILDENCKTEPGRERRREAADHRLLQGGQAGLEVRHRSATATTTPLTRPRFYAFDKVSKQPFNNGQPSDSKRGGARRTSTPESARTPRSSRSPTGILVVRDEKPRRRTLPTPTASGSSSDNPALSGTDIKNPEQNFDQQAGNEPIVTFDFTDKGRKAFQEITAQDRPARRRQRAAGRQPDPTLAALRDRARQRARLGAARSTTARTRTASTARPARRSPAASRSTRRRTWRRSSRSARCRSGSS